MTQCEHEVASLDEFTDDGMRIVEVDGTQILLTREGDVLRAVGATCPHAGGPLAEGVRRGERLICPWHKATFCLRSGAVLEPPAVDPLPRFDVRVAEGRVFVRVPAREPEIRKSTADPRCFVIIGAGGAGAVAAQTLRGAGFGGRVVMLDRENRVPYDRTILSKYALSGEEGAEAGPSFPAADVEILSDLGALAAPVPGGLGGLGLGTEASGANHLVEVLRLVGRGNLSLGRLYEAHVNVLRLIVRYGTDRQMQHAADLALDGQLFGLWVTDAPNAPVHLTEDRVLRGSKVPCSGAGHVRHALITARLPDRTTRMAVIGPIPARSTDPSGWVMLGGANGDGCSVSTDQVVAAQQAKTLEEAHAQVGMPEIINWQEKRMMETLYELRDQSIATHAYIINAMQGCLVYLGPAVGYGMPYATQYSNPQVDAYYTTSSASHIALPQAEPNGLYMPSDARGTWVMLKNPEGDDVKPVYVEPDVIVSPFRLTSRECR